MNVRILDEELRLIFNRVEEERKRHGLEAEFSYKRMTGGQARYAWA